jgi:hypothetical protein
MIFAAEPRPLRRGTDIAAGIALIVIPVLTGIVKVIVPGWFMLFYFFGLVLFVPLYALVIVIAATGFFSRRAAFAFAGSGRLRAQIAAWLHPAAFLAATAVLADAGDSGEWATPLSIVFDLPNSSPVVSLTVELFGPLAAISAFALVWLVVEWIFALIARRRVTVR